MNYISQEINNIKNTPFLLKEKNGKSTDMCEISCSKKSEGKKVSIKKS